MAVNLTLPAQQVDATAGAYTKLFKKVQANIVKPHGRDHVRHIFVEFSASAVELKRWIRSELAGRVSDAEALREAAQNRSVGGTDGGPVFGFFLSSGGYRKLGFDPADFGSEVFRDGMKDPNDAFGDRILGTVNKDPKVGAWEAPYREHIDALITVADDDRDIVDGQAAILLERVGTIGKVLTVEQGRVLRKIIPGRNPAGEPIEHFGYLDGLSNPRFTQQDLVKQSLVDGAGSKWDVAAPLNLVLVQDPFASEEDSYGSFLVYRKLAQDVPLFNERVVALAEKLGIDPELAGALVVGRFKDGTPVADHPTGGKAWTNDFDYSGPDNISRCPAQAHTRKVNPRGTTPLTSLKNERKRRIARRGIPYGAPLEGVADNVDEVGSADQPRGLLFMCFQHDIEEQFEFIQHTWVDNEEFPDGLLPFTKDTGDDPLIGQVKDSSQRWPKKWGSDDAGRKRANFESAVTFKGGEYFFAPSLPFIHNLE